MEEKLYRAALEARQNAYVPYSHFAVGAALLTAEGEIFTGCNVENASYGLSMCAERNAIFAAVSKGHREIKALCVVADTKEPVAPCGACRQVMGEFAIPLIILGNCQGKTKNYTWHELLPEAFAAEVLSK